MRVIFFLLAFISCTHARIVEYDLHVSDLKTTIAGHRTTALAINGSIPAPTLRFHLGDTARIRVHNDLKHTSTSTHWHGLLLPNAQDGVPYLTTPPIEPGTTHTFEFPITHTGTYWYHSHTKLQEQRGLYGAIIVTPAAQKSDIDTVLVLSDFTTERPSEIMRSLMRSDHYYSIRKGTMQSLYGAWQHNALTSYLAREKSRMPAMDISDIAYDAFLINGHTRSHLAAKPGQTARLRIINAGASTYFNLTTSLKNPRIISADGNDVSPVPFGTLLIGMGETYDIIGTIPSGTAELRATAQDGSGFTSFTIGAGKQIPARVPPSRDPYDTDSFLNFALHPDDPHSASPYRRLRAVRPTTLGKDHPTRTLTMHLTGDMERYRWSINHKTLSEDSTIRIHRGEILRIKFVNDTMMHHPMHLHGHFFRVLNGKGTRSPLKHTVDVPPMGSRTIEFLANEHGDWFFHCHLLYHMDAGMARVFSYDDQGPDHTPDLGPLAHDPAYFTIDGIILNNMTMGMADLMWGKNNLSAHWEHAFDSHHHDEENELLYSRYHNTNLSFLAGYRFSPHDFSDGLAFAGARYRLPYLIDIEPTIAHDGSARITLSKSIPLTSRLMSTFSVRYDTDEQWESIIGLDYRIHKNSSLNTTWHSAHGIGAGIGFQF